MRMISYVDLRTLNHFITNELSVVSTWTSQKTDFTVKIKTTLVRRATQTAMAHISLRLCLGLVAPVLTYTVDEILEYAPALFQRWNGKCI